MSKIYTLNELINFMASQNIKTLRLKRNEDCPELYKMPSTGKNPCLSGMRRLYWGKNALVVLKSGYAYKIN